MLSAGWIGHGNQVAKKLLTVAPANLPCALLGDKSIRFTQAHWCTFTIGDEVEFLTPQGKHAPPQVKTSHGVVLAIYSKASRSFVNFLSKRAAEQSNVSAPVATELSDTVAAQAAMPIGHPKAVYSTFVLVYAGEVRANSSVNPALLTALPVGLIQAVVTRTAESDVPPVPRQDIVHALQGEQFQPVWAQAQQELMRLHNFENSHVAEADTATFLRFLSKAAQPAVPMAILHHLRQNLTCTLPLPMGGSHLRVPEHRTRPDVLSLAHALPAAVPSSMPRSHTESGMVASAAVRFSSASSPPILELQSGGKSSSARQSWRTSDISINEAHSSCAASEPFIVQPAQRRREKKEETEEEEEEEKDFDEEEEEEDSDEEEEQAEPEQGHGYTRRTAAVAADRRLKAPAKQKTSTPASAAAPGKPTRASKGTQQASGSNSSVHSKATAAAPANTRSASASSAAAKAASSSRPPQAKQHAQRRDRAQSERSSSTGGRTSKPDSAGERRPRSRSPAQLLPLLGLTSDLEKQEKTQPFAWALYLQLKLQDQPKATGRRGGGSSSSSSSAGAVKEELMAFIERHYKTELRVLATQICKHDPALAAVMYNELEQFSGDATAASSNLVALLKGRWRQKQGTPTAKPTKDFVWVRGRSSVSASHSVVDYLVQERVAAAAAAAAQATADAAAAASSAASSSASRHKQASTSGSSLASEPAPAADSRHERKRGRSRTAAAVDQPSPKIQRNLHTAAAAPAVAVPAEASHEQLHRWLDQLLAARQQAAPTPSSSAAAAAAASSAGCDLQPSLAAASTGLVPHAPAQAAAAAPSSVQASTQHPPVAPTAPPADSTPAAAALAAVSGIHPPPPAAASLAASALIPTVSELEYLSESQEANQMQLQQVQQQMMQMMAMLQQAQRSSAPMSMSMPMPTPTLPTPMLPIPTPMPTLPMPTLPVPTPMASFSSYASPQRSGAPMSMSMLPMPMSTPTLPVSTPSFPPQATFRAHLREVTGAATASSESEHERLEGGPVEPQLSRSQHLRARRARHASANAQFQQEMHAIQQQQQQFQQQFQQQQLQQQFQQQQQQMAYMASLASFPTHMPSTAWQQPCSVSFPPPKRHRHDRGQ